MTNPYRYVRDRINIPAVHMPRLRRNRPNVHHAPVDAGVPNTMPFLRAAGRRFTQIFARRNAADNRADRTNVTVTVADAANATVPNAPPRLLQRYSFEDGTNPRPPLIPPNTNQTVPPPPLANTPGPLPPRTHVLDVFTTAQTFASTEAKFPPRMTAQVVDKIKDHVLNGLQNWDTSKDAVHAKTTYPLHEDHKLLGLFLDGLYVHYFKRNINSWKVVPEDEVLFRAFLAAVENVPEEYQGTARQALLDFEPNARETLRILEEEFSKYPQLRDLAPENRWRTLVDPIKVDMLEEQGIQPNNPMQAFMLDCGRGGRFGYNGAKAFVALGQNLNAPIKRNLVEILHKAMNGPGYAPPYVEGYQHWNERQKWGAQFTPDGIKKLGEDMHYLDQLNFDVQATFEIEPTAGLPENITYVFKGKDVGKPERDRGGVKLTFETLAAVIDDMKAHTQFARTPQAVKVKVDGCGKQIAFKKHIIDEKLETLRDELARATTLNQQLLALATCICELDHSHLYKYGNLRTWFKYFCNHVLDRLSQPFTMLRDPLICEGKSPEELVADLREGQGRWRSWLKPELQ